MGQVQSLPLIIVGITIAVCITLYVVLKRAKWL
jgi:hypothetical protein